MKHVSLLFTAVVFFFLSCKKDKPADNNNNNNVITLPTDPDTLTTGWQKVGTIPIEDWVSDVFFTDNNNGYITSNYGIYKSENGGLDWIKINDATQVSNIGAKGSNACFVNASSNIYHSSNYGQDILSESYESAIPSGAPGFQDCFYSTNNNCYAISRLYVWKSIDGGAHFDTLMSFPESIGSVGSLFFTDDLHGWTCRNKNTVYQTTDGGHSWATNLVFSNSQDWMPVFFVDQNTGFVATSYTVYKTTDGGATWGSNIITAADSIITDIHFINSQEGYACAGTKIFKTTDGGVNWTTVVALGKKRINEIHFTDANHGWACGQYGYVLRFNQ